MVLTANPGSLDDETTFKLARYIRYKKLNTHLLSHSVIASGAVDLFLAGVNRTMASGARVGVHSWAEDFYWYTIYAASADEIYWVSNEEIERFNLITRGILAPDDDTNLSELK